MVADFSESFTGVSVGFGALPPHTFRLIKLYFLSSFPFPMLKHDTETRMRVCAFRCGARVYGGWGGGPDAFWPWLR